MTDVDERSGTTVRVPPALRVASALALLQAVLHVVSWSRSADPRLLAPHGVALLHDAMILGAVALVARTGARLMPPTVGRAGDSASVLALAFIGLLLSVYPQVLRENLAFPANLFDSSAHAAAMMLTEYLGIGRLWPALAATGVVVLALWWSPRSMPVTRSVRAAALVVFAAGAVTAPRSPNPWVFSVVQSLSSIASPAQREVPSLARPPARRSAAVGGDLPLDLERDAPARTHVFLIVLEGVTATAFEREFLANGQGFCEARREHALYFSRYYATNLDSYTSLIAMLTGIQVPYRAYADEGLYAAVNSARSIPRLLRGAGYHTAFVSTYGHQPFVPARADWDRVLDRKDLPSLEGWVALGTSRMEAATEDRAALDTIVNMAAAHDRTFVLHELVYGHSTEWRATTGQTQLAYYDQYLRELSVALEKKGLLETSLFVVVSDHGDRARSSDAENYRVPLLIVGSNVMRATNAGFLSHLDLPAIMIAVMRRREMPAARLSQLVVGSSERWVYGQICSDGSHLFVDDGTGAVTARRGATDAAAVRRSFQAMLNAFGAAFGPAPQ